MRVALITTVAPERCGVRTYADELVKNATRDNPDVEFKLIGRPFDGSVPGRTVDCDIVHLLHVHGMMDGITIPMLQQWRMQGKKTVCTFNESTSMNRSAYTEAFDRTIVHQKTSDGFQLIYHGIPTAPLKPYTGELAGFVGTSGFPIGFKNYPLAAKLANAVGLKLFAILPSSQHADVDAVARAIQSAAPGSVVDTSFPEHEYIIDRLSQCLFTIYPYSHTNTGIGGSAKTGMATNRPCVISRVVRFADILDTDLYRNEYYVIPDPYPTFESSIATVQQCFVDIQNGVARVPKETINDMSWTKSAQEYVNVYRELMGQK